MASPSSGEGTGNHPTTATAGGASAIPTPANNSGGGSGWGDPGFKKGGGAGAPTLSHSLGHHALPNPAASFGNFLTLKEQKEAAETNACHRIEQAAYEGGAQKPLTSTGGESCASEDHSFRYHKPGCPQTLPGSEKIKGAWESATKYGRGD